MRRTGFRNGQRQFVHGDPVGHGERVQTSVRRLPCQQFPQQNAIRPNVARFRERRILDDLEGMEKKLILRILERLKWKCF